MKNVKLVLFSLVVMFVLFGCNELMLSNEKLI